MESEPSKGKRRDNDVIVEIQAPGDQFILKRGGSLQENGVFESKGGSSSVEMTGIQMNLVTGSSLPPSPIAKSPSLRQRSYAKPKSRIAEPPYVRSSKPAETLVENAKEESSDMQALGMPSPSVKEKTSPPITSSKASLLASSDDEDDADVYRTQRLILDNAKSSKKKVKVMAIIEWSVFVLLVTVLIASLTVDKLKSFEISSLRLWRWCVFILVILCGHLLTEWLTNSVAFLIEKNFLFKKKVLYFIFGLKKSVRVVLWLALILLAWLLLINPEVPRSENTSKILNHITRGIVSTLIGAVLWMVKTLFIKLVASSFHVNTYFDRIQDSIFHQYILQALSGEPIKGDSSNISCEVSVSKGKKKGSEVIDVDKLSTIRREKVSAWTMAALIKAVNSSGLPSMSEALDESDIEKQEITSEAEAYSASSCIFRNVAKPGHKYIDEDDLLRFMPKDKVDSAFPLFEGVSDSRRIKKSSFRNWVVKAYQERKSLVISLKDAKTGIEELNKLASGLILIVIVIVWLLVMEITTTAVLVFISSQILLLAFMFGNSAKTVFEAIIFVFVMHPFDVGDRCVIDGAQMVVDEMNIMTTIFLKSGNEKLYYPNSVLATKPISNFNRSPEMMGDSVEFSVNFSTSLETIAALREKIKEYLESKPQHWSPNHSVMLLEIENLNKLKMALYVTHTINFQNSGDRASRRSDLVLQMKNIFEELQISYTLLPQQVQINPAGSANGTTAGGA